jgi:DNA invertase Pin-like site-specific DNA recombinase
VFICLLLCQYPIIKRQFFNFCHQLIAFAFGLSAEIERTLISQRTRKALARMKAESIHVGRPRGACNLQVKLTGKEAEIRPPPVISKKTKNKDSGNTRSPSLDVEALYLFARSGFVI